MALQLVLAQLFAWVRTTSPFPFRRSNAVDILVDQNEMPASLSGLDGSRPSREE